VHDSIEGKALFEYGEAIVGVLQEVAREPAAE
jgi:hypothetical protein